MRHSPISAYKAFYLVVLIFSLAACAKDQGKKNDPTPQYSVKVKMISTDVAGLGAGAEIYIYPQDRTAFSVLNTSLPDNGVKESETFTTLKTGEKINVGLGFEKAKTGSSIVPRTTSKLRGEIWVNGQLKASAELDRNTPSQNPEYPTNFTEYTLGQ